VNCTQRGLQRESSPPALRVGWQPAKGGEKIRQGCYDAHNDEVLAIVTQSL
jgi:hypothetical protein